MKKWKNIKDCYYKHIKKKTKSGQAAESGRKYIYAQQLSFLQQAAATTETQSSLQEEQDENMPAESTEVADSGPGPSERRRELEETRKKKTTKRSIEESLINYMNAPIPVAPVDTNPDRAFFESMLPCIQLFTEDEKLYFRGEVLNLAKRMRLSRTNIPPTPSGGSYYNHPHHAPLVLNEMQVQPPSAADSARTVQPSPTWTTTSGSLTTDDEFDLFNL